MNVARFLRRLACFASLSLACSVVPCIGHAESTFYGTATGRLGLELSGNNSPGGTAGLSLMAGIAVRTERGMSLSGPLPLDAELTLARGAGLNEFRVETAVFAVMFYGPRPVRGGSGARFGVVRLRRVRPLDRDLLFELAAISGQMRMTAGGVYVFLSGEALGVHYAERATSPASFTGVHLFATSSEIGAALGDADAVQLIPLIGGGLSSNLGGGESSGITAATELGIWGGVDVDVSPSFAIRSRARYDWLSGAGMGAADSRWRVQTTAHFGW